MPAGQPTKYYAGRVLEVEDYIKTCPHVLPTRKGFALISGVCDKTLENWSKSHPKFLQALAQIDREQHQRLIDKGLDKSYSSVIAKLLLCSNHGYTDKADVALSGSVQLLAPTIT